MSIVPVDGISNDRTRVDEVIVKEHAPVAAVQLGHLDAVHHGVRPEHEAREVVYGNALWAAQVWGNKRGEALRLEVWGNKERQVKKDTGDIIYGSFLETSQDWRDGGERRGVTQVRKRERGSRGRKRGASFKLH